MLIIVFAAAVMTLAVPVILTIVVVSVRAEDRHGQLPSQAPGAVARSVRRLTGLRVGQAACSRVPASPRRDRPERRPA